MGKLQMKPLKIESDKIWRACLLQIELPTIPSFSKELNLRWRRKSICRGRRHRKSTTFIPIFYTLLLFILFSCTPSLTKNLTKIPVEQTAIENPYFSDTEKDYLYKAKIEAFGNFFGGILVIKKLATQHHRIVFTTEFGSKIFDFELEESDFKVNYIIAALDKKLIINVLRKDFQLLIKNPIEINKKYQNADYTVYESKFNKNRHFYFFSAPSERLEKIVQASSIKEKVVVSLEGKTPQSILIQHQGIPLKIELKGF